MVEAAVNLIHQPERDDTIMVKDPFEGDPVRAYRR